MASAASEGSRSSAVRFVRYQSAALLLFNFPDTLEIKSPEALNLNPETLNLYTPSPRPQLPVLKPYTEASSQNSGPF